MAGDRERGIGFSGAVGGEPEARRPPEPLSSKPIEDNDMFLLRKDSVHRADPAYIEQVRRWQGFLKQQGFTITAVTGEFGDETEVATKAFQQRAGFADAEVDGKAGPDTFTAAERLGFDSGLQRPDTELIGSVQLAKVKGSDKVSVAFKQKVIKIAERLETDPSFLMAVMSFETGNTLRPDIESFSGSGATGLIQFMPKTARGLGTTTEKLARMTAEEQLDFVEAHFKPFKGRMKTVEDCYMAVLLPRAVGKPNNHVLFVRGTVQYKQNSGLDRDGDGNITKLEAASRVSALLKGAATEPVALGLVNVSVLKRGDRGAEVQEIQELLVRLGFLTQRAMNTGKGSFGPKTEAAVKEFQHEHGLDPGGTVTLETRTAIRAAAKAAPPETTVDRNSITTVLPASGRGFQTYNREPGGRDQFGRAAVIAAVIELGAKWHALHPDIPLQIGDISLKNGGPFPPHASHRFGNDVDLRPFRKDLQLLPENISTSTYSHALTKEFVQLVRKEFPKTLILFNDPKLISAGLTRHAAGHDNHLHIRFLD